MLPQDYSGEAVNAKNFLAVLAGKKASTALCTHVTMLSMPACCLEAHGALWMLCCMREGGRGRLGLTARCMLPLQAPKVLGSSGKILKSGPNDRVFVYYADHGAPGTFYSAAM